MSYLETAFTHGGAGAYKQALNALLSNGWSVVDGTANSLAGALGAPLAQTSNLPIRTAAVTALSTNIELPVSWIAPTKVQREVISGGATADLVEGVDYTIDYRRGRIQAIGGGWTLGGVQRFLINSGNYSIRKGYVVLSSPGVSASETHLIIGMRLESVGPNSSQQWTGVRWVAFYSFTVGDNFDVVDGTKRNLTAFDVVSVIHPSASGTMVASVTADRIAGSFTVPESTNAWFYAGLLSRVRPVAEQSCATIIVGNSSDEIGTQTDDDGPVGCPTQAGNTSNTSFGSTYNPVAGRFTETGANFTELNANAWSKDVDGASDDISPSSIETTPGNIYFEIHPVIVARDIHVRNFASASEGLSYVFGSLRGVYSLCMLRAQHLTTLTYGGLSYITLKVGGSVTRFIALEKT